MVKRHITSKPGLFGMTYHYENGKYIGKSRPSLLGNHKIHYDANGRQIGTSRPGALAEEVHYDKRNKRFVSTYEGPIGKIHMSNGSSVGKTTPGIMGRSYSSIGSGYVEADDLQDEVFDIVEQNEFGMDGEINPDFSVDRKGIAKKVIGVLFLFVTILLLVMTILFARKGQNIAPGIAACIISIAVAVFCLRPVDWSITKG